MVWLAENQAMSRVGQQHSLQQVGQNGWFMLQI